MGKSNSWDGDGQDAFGFLDSLDNHKSKKYAPRCFESHKPLSLGEGLVIYGGSCITPVVKDADIYIGFDAGMILPPRRYPWDTSPEQKDPVEHIYFRIQDGSVPKSENDFKKMVVWVAEQIRAGKKVHAGCIGGHGRTGLFFSALVGHMLGEKAAVSYVRKNYCTKAVETTVQIDFLKKHYGLKDPEAVPSYHTRSFSTEKTNGGSKKNSSSHSGVGKSLMPQMGTTMSKKAGSITPVMSAKLIW